LRSIRFSLRHRDIFTQQIRAILRAGADAPVRIMFPMISSLDELREAQALVRHCEQQLEEEHLPHQRSPLLGIMIELPSTLEIIDDLAVEAGFFSIGTNDLVQYMLAVDRTNEKVADLYLPHHPAVLRGLAKIVNATQRHGLDVSICGDMAHDPCYIPFLVGVGIRKFSLDARYLPKIQEAIMGLDTREAERLAGEILACSSIQSVSRFFSKRE
jgi:phosphotransferase system, enzyme I, PtsP